MSIYDYSTQRDVNGGIVPGNIRTSTFETQQIVNSIRQLMADLAEFGASDVFPVWHTIFDSDVSAVPGFITFPDLDEYKSIRINAYIRPDTVAGVVGFQYSSTNGSVWINGASDYQNDMIYTASGSGTVSPATAASAWGYLSWGSTIPPVTSNNFGIHIYDLVLDVMNNSNVQRTWKGHVDYYTGSAVAMGTTFGRPGTAALQTPSAMNAIRIFCGTSANVAFSGHILVEGRKG